MDNLTKISLISLKDKQFSQLKLAIILKSRTIKQMPKIILNYSSADERSPLLSSPTNLFRIFINLTPFHNKEFSPKRANLHLFAFSSISSMLTLYKSSWLLQLFKGNFDKLTKSKRAKFRSRLRSNFDNKRKVNKDERDKRRRRKRWLFDKKNKKKSIRSKIIKKAFRFRCYGKINSKLIKSNKLTSKSRLSLRFRTRGRLFFNNSICFARKPKLYKESRSFKASSWFKVHRTSRLLNNPLTNLFNLRSSLRNKTLLSNLRVLNLLDSGVTINKYSNSLNLPNISRSCSQRAIRNTLAFKSRFLINPSESLLKLSFFNKLRSGNPQMNSFGHRRALDMAYKRVIIFFVKSLIDKSSRLGNFEKDRLLHKLLRSYVFNLITKPNKIRFNKESLIFNLFIRNYLTSRWESRYRKNKRRKKKKLFFKLRKISLEISKPLSIKANDTLLLGEKRPTSLNASRFIYRFIYRLTLNYLVNKLQLKIKYDKLRLMKLSNLPANTPQGHKKDYTTMKKRVVSNISASIKKRTCSDRYNGGKDILDVPGALNGTYLSSMPNINFKDATLSKYLSDLMVRNLYSRKNTSRHASLNNLSGRELKIRQGSRANRTLFAKGLRALKSIQGGKFKLINMPRKNKLLNRYSLQSYKLLYLGQVLKLKPCKLSLSTGLKSFFKNRYRKKYRRFNKRFKKFNNKRRRISLNYNKLALSPMIKPIKESKASNRLLFNNLSGVKVSKFYNTSRYDYNLETGILANRYTNQSIMKNFFSKRNKKYPVGILPNPLSMDTQLPALTLPLLRRVNRRVKVRINSFKTAFIREVCSSFRNWKLNNEIAKLADLSRKEVTKSKELIYTNFIFKNIISSKDDLNISRFSTNVIRSKSKAPKHVVNRLLTTKPNSILFFKRRKNIKHYINQLATCRWSFRLSRFKRLSVAKLKLGNRIRDNSLAKSSVGYRAEHILNRIKQATYLSNTVGLSRYQKLLMNSAKPGNIKTSSNTINKKRRAGSRTRFVFKKRKLLKRIIMRSRYLRPSSSIRLSNVNARIVKAKLNRVKNRRKRMLMFKLPNYLKNTRLLSRMTSKGLFRGRVSYRPNRISKLFYRLRRSRKKSFFSKKKSFRSKNRRPFRFRTADLIRSRTSIVTHRIFKRINGRISKKNMFITTLKRIKRNRIRRNYPTLFINNGFSRKINFKYYDRIRSRAYKQLSLCPKKVQGKLRKRYFIEAINSALRLDRNSPNISYTSLYRLIKPHRRWSRWQDSVFVRNKLKRVKAKFLKRKKNPNSLFYSKLMVKKRRLDFKFLNKVRNTHLSVESLNKVDYSDDSKNYKRYKRGMKVLNKNIVKPSIREWSNSVILRLEPSRENRLNRFKRRSIRNRRAKSGAFIPKQLKSMKFKKSMSKTVRIKKLPIIRPVTSKNHFKRKLKVFSYKRFTRRSLRNRIGRSTFRKFAVRYALHNRPRLFMINKVVGKSDIMPKTNRYNDNSLSFYSLILANSLKSYSTSLLYEPVKHDSLHISHLPIVKNLSPISELYSSAYNITRLKNAASSPVIGNLRSIYMIDTSELNPKHNSNHQPNTSVINIQLISDNKGKFTKIEGCAKSYETFHSFSLRYLKLINKSTQPGILNMTSMQIRMNSSNNSNLNLVNSNNNNNNNRYFNFNKRTNNKDSRYNSYNLLVNLIAKQAFNDKLNLISVDLLKYCLNSNLTISRITSLLTEDLKFEFSRLSPTFFIDEAISLILCAIRFKDTNLFMGWFTRFIHKLPIRKHKRAVAFLNKLFKLIYFKRFKRYLHTSGVCFDIRGKVGVTGSKKKRHRSINLGRYSSTNKTLKWVTQKSTVVTSTGVLGVTFTILY